MTVDDVFVLGRIVPVLYLAATRHVSDRYTMSCIYIAMLASYIIKHMCT